jgi:formate dehydrogenase iron-sulfur subunit
MFGTKEAMIEQADSRIVDLQSRGFENAGLYDPQGVGGTHVMYVLHHADKPEIYAGLPKDPHISMLVGFWKGGFKLFGLATLAFTAIGGFLHYVTAGPDEVPKAEEEEAAKQAEGHVT